MVLGNSRELWVSMEFRFNHFSGIIKAQIFVSVDGIPADAHFDANEFDWLEIFCVACKP